jgi:hypothetical protein
MSLSRDEIIKLVGGENTDAKKFAHAFVAWVHWIDDVIDKDHLWLPADAVRVNLEMLMAFSENPFFQTNKYFLMPLIIQASRAFGDSLKWAERDCIKDRRAADVLKSAYHEVIWHVAYLVGGWDHMCVVTEKCREIDYDAE